MKSAINHLAKVLATGFVVLVLLSLPLFWARFTCEIILEEMMPRDFREVTFEPSGLVPPEIENDPNAVRRSSMEARMRPEASALSLGFSDYFIAMAPGGRWSNVYRYDRDDQDWMYFDEETGQIVFRETHKVKMPDQTVSVRKMQIYAGPEGISETADKTLGRFIDPIIDLREGIIYDKKLRCFFRIEQKTVVKGPQLGDDDPHRPVQIGELGKNSSLLYLDWEPPMRKATPEEREERGFRPRSGYPYNRSIVHRSGYYPADHPLLVLDESGQIDLLDKQTLTFSGIAGRLPAPESVFPSTKSVTAKDLLSYEVLSLAFNTDLKYRGMFAAGVGREGTAMALAVFNERGELIKTGHTRSTDRRGRRNIPSSKTVFWEVPGAPATTVAKYLLENLHPPILSVVSYLTADSFEAASGHRALFLLPNSFIAMEGRDTTGNFAGRFVIGLFLILPSITLAILLAWRVSADAAVVGLSENARLYWIIGTLAFGLAAYITYRLTRPKITLVTCQNCGKMRRPDMAKCHRCGSKWHVPELTPPAWRVLNWTEQVPEDSAADAEETSVE